jgi:hypothetical protein
MDEVGFSRLARLERTGALRVLVSLLAEDLFISQLIKRYDNKGIASQPAIEKTRTALVELELIEEYEKFNELTQKTRLYLRLTGRGRRVAESVEKIADSLSRP